jgi:hypothetical protein
MAFVYQKTVDDKAVIFGAREHLPRKFDFGAWTEARIGMFWSLTTLGGDNTKPASDEIVPVVTPFDCFSFGLKDSSATAPGVAGSMFIGMITETQSKITVGGAFGAGNVGIGETDANIEVLGYDGATPLARSSTASVGNWMNSDPEAASGYASFVGMRFVVADLGLATQTITVSASFTANIGGTDYSAANLRTYLSAFASPSTEIEVDWNDGADALVVPDCWFLRNPFFNNRIRVHAMNALKVAPV